MLSGRLPTQLRGGTPGLGWSKVQQRTPHIIQPLSEAISWSGGRNLPGRSWGGVTAPRTAIL